MRSTRKHKMTTLPKPSKSLQCGIAGTMDDLPPGAAGTLWKKAKKYNFGTNKNALGRNAREWPNWVAAFATKTYCNLPHLIFPDVVSYKLLSVLNRV